MSFVTFKMYTLIAELRCIMQNKELEFLQFLSKQNQEFLQKVKGQRIYYFDDVMNKKAKLIAHFSKDGRTLNFPRIWAVPFKQSFSPNINYTSIDISIMLGYSLKIISLCFMIPMISMIFLKSMKNESSSVLILSKVCNSHKKLFQKLLLTK